MGESIKKAERYEEAGLIGAVACLHFVDEQVKKDQNTICLLSDGDKEIYIESLTQIALKKFLC